MFKTATLLLFLATSMAFILIGCATTEEKSAISKALFTERLLSAAGFRIRLADTAEKDASLRSLSQHRLLPRQRDGDTYYVYADAEECGCLYLGDESAYRRYQDILIRDNVADREQMVADEDDEDEMNWSLWGG